MDAEEVRRKEEESTIVLGFVKDGLCGANTPRFSFAFDGLESDLITDSEKPSKQVGLNVLLNFSFFV